jgi:proteasome lid subunit RPN8/RPN11
MVTMPRSLLDEVTAYALEAAPSEVCGWLAGQGDIIERFHPVRNVAEEPEARFEMHLEGQLLAMKEILGGGLELTATFHSHPRTSPEPSSLDLALAAYPGSLHLIVSLAGARPEARCYRIDGSGSTPVRLSVQTSS